MFRVLSKIWPHLVIWLVLGAYVFLSPRIHDRFYVKQGRPVTDRGDLSRQPVKGYGFVDNLTTEDPELGLFRLKGWAFAPVRPQLRLQDYERKLILFSRTQIYVLPAELEKRLDVQSYFAAQDLGLDVTWTGFSALISSGPLKPGCYEIRILLNNADGNFSYTVRTSGTLRRTPNTLVLEGPNASDCSDK